MKVSNLLRQAERAFPFTPVHQFPPSHEYPDQIAGAFGPVEVLPSVVCVGSFRPTPVAPALEPVLHRSALTVVWFRTVLDVPSGKNADLGHASWIGRPKAGLVLDDAERRQLQQWARQARTAQFHALRAKIVLRCAEGGTDQQAAVNLGIDTSTVDRRRARFIAKRLDGLQDEPRSGASP
ncbi:MULTISPECIES: helix-turn-helix domain-containing protein [unclassified Streptomyces]|uniref:helix-turn-helix domain-containing protein n=1 Tax=unclassified Streptomyces TaxID=2593676 RepID=UPI00403CE39C